MRYLIDTQILIWYQLNSPRISPHVAEILLDVSNEILVSQITLFEISVKQKIGKLSELDVSIEEIVSVIQQDGFAVLNLENQHIANYDRIPLAQDHRDPFDRLIIATALSENVSLISADEKFRSYKEIVNLVENN